MEALPDARAVAAEVYVPLFSVTEPLGVVPEPETVTFTVSD